MTTQQKDRSLPTVRISTQLLDRLERVIERSVSHKVSDHVRYALERYVEAEETQQQQQLTTDNN